MSRGQKRIEMLKRLVFGLEEVLKFLSREVIVRHQCVTVFIVDLPAGDVCVMAKTLGHLRGNLPAIFAVDWRSSGGMSAIAVCDAAPVRLHAKNLRIFLREPGGRGCPRRSEDF